MSTDVTTGAAITAPCPRLTCAGSSSDEKEPLDGTLVVGPPAADPGCDDPVEEMREGGSEIGYPEIGSESSSRRVEPKVESIEAEGVRSWNGHVTVM